MRKEEFVITVESKSRLAENILCEKGMSVYDALIHALGTAGTGGFSNMNSSVAAFHSPIIEWIITIFMLLFGVNFALYFQLLERQ